MAIDQAAIQLWRMLKPHLPRMPVVLEIGQANWFGDVGVKDVEELEGIPGLSEMDFFEVARAYYAEVLDYTVIDSVDGNGEDGRVHQLDLNKPLPFDPESYDIVINTGTTEHVFDQRQVFKTMHDMAKVGGLIVGCYPTSGCVDHGFFNYHPCLLHGIAQVNRYETLAALRSEMDGDQVMHLAWKKVEGGEFRIPYQGGYAEAMGGGIRQPGVVA